MYNLVFGRNSNSSLLLAMLGNPDVGRFRDAWIENGKIAVYTRNGGGNREWMGETWENIRLHPNYLYDEDDDFDCTYATIYFSFPEEHKDILETFEESPSGDERWQALFDKLGCE